MMTRKRGLPETESVEPKRPKCTPLDESKFEGEVKIFSTFLLVTRARTEPIHFDSPKWINNNKKILIRFDFDSSRTMTHLRIKIKSNEKSQEGESWFTHLRIIGWFNFESKANQTESRINLARHSKLRQTAEI